MHIVKLVYRGMLTSRQCELLQPSEAEPYPHFQATVSPSAWLLHLQGLDLTPGLTTTL